MKFLKSDWVPGAKAIFEKFADYKPRTEKADWLAGGKNILVDRIEWVIIPDAATAAAALQSGEVDWWETPLADLVPTLRSHKDINVDIGDPLGNIGAFRMNHLFPPFNNPKVRQAVLTALNQEDYMRAVVGDDDKLWKALPGFFTPGTPLYTEQGGDMLKKRNVAEAKKLLAESGYKGEPVVCVVAQDMAPTKSMGDVTAELLKSIGMTVDFVATDWGTVGARRASKASPSQGGWSMLHSWQAGADTINPLAYVGLRANGEKAWFGWPDIPAIEEQITAWFAASDAAAEKVAMSKLNKAAIDNVVFAPTGFFLTNQAWRKSLSGVVPGPLPFFWNVTKG
jgi:peptide/nickel transport system substrate-binding protein